MPRCAARPTAPQVCLTWRGEPHPLSTLIPDQQMPLTAIFGLPWDDFCMRLGMPLADRPR